MTPTQIRDRIAFFSVLALSFAIAFPVFAQVAATPGGVDLTPTANSLITTIAGALTVAAGTISWFVVRFISGKIGINNTQAELLVQQQIDHGLVMAIQFGEAWLKEQVADPRSPIKHLTFNNLFLDVALRYFKNSFPDIIARYRARLTDDRIKQMITSRVAPYLKPPVVDSGELVTITNDAVASVPVSPGSAGAV